MKKVQLHTYYVKEAYVHDKLVQGFHVVYLARRFLIKYYSSGIFTYVGWYDSDDNTKILPNISSEESYFQNSLIWDYDIEIEMCKHIQMNINFIISNNTNSDKIVEISY